MKKPAASGYVARPPVTAILDRLYGESMWSFIQHASVVMIDGLSESDQERWKLLEDAFRSYGANPYAGPRETAIIDSGLNENELCWFAARSDGHLFCDLLRLGGISSSSALNRLCRIVGLPPKSDPLDILLENDLFPEAFPREMAQFIAESGSMPAFAAFLAESRANVLDLTGIENTRYSSDPAEEAAFQRYRATAAQVREVLLKAPEGAYGQTDNRWFFADPSVNFSTFHVTRRERELAEVEGELRMACDLELGASEIDALTEDMLRWLEQPQIVQGAPGVVSGFVREAAQAALAYQAEIEIDRRMP